MNLPGIAVALSIVAGFSFISPTPADQSPDHAVQDMSALLPSGVKVDHFSPVADGTKTYFVNASGEVWLYTLADKATTRLDAGPAWDLTVSATGTAIAYTKAGADRSEQHVWVLSLDPATGLARGSARQIGTQSSDAPALSPDAKSIAFGRDDPSGVGQTLVVAAIAGGAERAVASRLPSSLGAIHWTPDGKVLYFGVNPPVACVPGWSCLPLAADLRDPPGAIERVAASGGPATTIVAARGVAPGLSPDGKTLLYADVTANSTRQWIVANADGSRRDAFSLPTSETPVGWLRGSTVLIRRAGAGPRGGAGQSGSPSIVAMDLLTSHSQQR